MRRAAAIAVDALLISLTGLVIGIIVTGGGVVVAGGHRVSVTGVDIPLLALTVIAALRYATLQRTGFLGRDKWQRPALERRAGEVVAALRQRIDGMRPRAALETVLLGAVAATIVKALLAWAIQGSSAATTSKFTRCRSACCGGPAGIVHPPQRLVASAGRNDPGGLIVACRLSALSAAPVHQGATAARRHPRLGLAGREVVSRRTRERAREQKESPYPSSGAIPSSPSRSRSAAADFNALFSDAQRHASAPVRKCGRDVSVTVGGGWMS